MPGAARPKRLRTAQREVRLDGRPLEFPGRESLVMLPGENLQSINLRRHITMQCFIGAGWPIGIFANSRDLRERAKGYWP